MHRSSVHSPAQDSRTAELQAQVEACGACTAVLGLEASGPFGGRFCYFLFVIVSMIDVAVISSRHGPFLRLQFTSAASSHPQPPAPTYTHRAVRGSESEDQHLFSVSDTAPTLVLSLGQLKR